MYILHRGVYTHSSYKCKQSVTSKPCLGLQVLNLHKSQDLLCHNLLCEKVGEACICRLSATLERLPALEELVLSSNQLTALPTSVWQLSNLKCLDISDNKLEQLPPEVANLRQLQVRLLACTNLVCMEKAVTALLTLR